MYSTVFFVLPPLHSGPGGGELPCLFKWAEQATERALRAGGTDFWSEAPLGETLVLAGGQGAVIRYY